MSKINRILRGIGIGLLVPLAPSICSQACASELDNLINALIEVESNGDTKAVGDGGKSCGQLQIQMVVIKDVNKFYGRNFTAADRFESDKSKEICRLYLTHWGKQYQKTSGKQPTNEIYSRIWNSGPRGYLKQCSKPYWERVKRELKKQEM